MFVYVPILHPYLFSKMSETTLVLTFFIWSLISNENSYSYHHPNMSFTKG